MRSIEVKKGSTRPMSATFAQGGRTHLYQGRNTEFGFVLFAYGACHTVGVQLSVLRQSAVQTSFHFDADA